MSELTVNTKVLVDDSEVDETQKKIDKQQQEWAITRRETLQQLNSIALGINLTIQAVRITARASGKALDPIFSSLLTLVGSTTSLILATASIMAASSLGVLTGVALTLAGAAYGYQVGQTIQLMADREKMQTTLDNIEATLSGMGFTGVP